MISFIPCPLQGQHCELCQPGHPPVPVVYIPIFTEHFRRGDNFIPIFVQMAVGTANADEDYCPNLIEAYDGWYVVPNGWSDNGAGGEFGYFDEEGRWVPHNGDLTTHYRTAKQVGGEIIPIDAKVVRISVTVDDYAWYADDPRQSSTTWNLDDYLTVWEFWITPCPEDWRPKLDEDLAFIAWIEPATDHRGNPMVGIIGFALASSNEPGYCLNACRLGSQGQWAWDGTTCCHDDYQFLPEQPDLVVFPRDQTPEGVGYNYNTAVSVYATNMATVTVRCLDYGGWAYLEGYVTGFFGEGEARRIDKPDLFFVDIPVDENYNHIADCWEDQMQPPSRDAMSDEDHTPQGDGTDGDGLSLYEEYRGLKVRGVWRDFDPKVKDMFVMNFGAGNENPYVPPTIPNSAIDNPNGFPGAGVPGENNRGFWLLNANEGVGYPYRVVNFLNGYAHARDVYAAVVVPGDIRGYQDANNDGQPDDVNGDGVIDDNDLAVDVDAYGFTYGPIWDNAGGPIAPPGDWGYIPQFWGPPVIEIDVAYIRRHQQDRRRNPNGLTELQAQTWIVGHELGHTVLWHQAGYGHHAGNTTFDCLIWQWMDWRANPPTEFCVINPGCQNRWKVNP